MQLKPYPFPTLHLGQMLDYPNLVTQYLAEFGCFHLAGDVFVHRMSNTAVEVSENLHALSSAEKSELDISSSFRGYSMRPSPTGSAQPIMENINFMETGFEPESTHWFAKIVGVQPWPNSQPRLSCAVLKCRKNFESLARKLLSSICMSVGHDRLALLDSAFEHPTTYLKFIKYTASDNRTDTYLGSHLDFGGITIIAASDLAGLFVAYKNRHVGVRSAPGEFFVMCGEALARLTEGKVKPALHYVAGIEANRYSTVYCFDPRADVLLPPNGRKSGQSDSGRNLSYGELTVLRSFIMHGLGR